MILILKRASPTTRRRKVLAQKTAMIWWQEFRMRVSAATTWWEEFTKKSLAASPVHLQENRKKSRSTSQPQFRSDNTPATIEADQTLLALQQLANNNNTANFHNNNNKNSKLPKSLTTTMPTFDGKMKSSSCLKIFSKRASKSIISWLKRTESTTSILSWGGTRYRHLKTLMTQPENTFWQFFEGNK